MDGFLSARALLAVGLLVGCADAAPKAPALLSSSEKPTTTLLESPPARTNQDSARFEFESSIDASSFVCRLDAEKRKACSSPHSVEGLEEGAHYFEVSAVSPSNVAELEPLLFALSLIHI